MVVLLVDVSCSVLGGYPRNRRVRHLVRDYEEGRISGSEFYRILTEESLFLVGIQKALRCDCIVDGMLEWHDIFRPFVNAWRGVYPSGLLRYFDNNFFYRIPVFHEAPEPMTAVFSTRLRAVEDYLGDSRFKVVIPGPATFVSLSKNETGKDDVWLATKIAEALNNDLKIIGDGNIVIQVDEPSLTDKELYAKTKGHLSEIYDALLSELNTSVRVSVYFGCILEEAYKELLDVKNIDFIVLDAVDCRNFHSAVKEYGVKNDKLGLGVIEARDIYRDDYDRVKKSVETLVENAGTELKLIHLTTSTWLDLIPYDYAVEKTRILSEYSKRIQDEVA
jgi:5-methyltetrahydropteroyltriglutamate--homocysteine methyltransferase